MDALHDRLVDLADDAPTGGAPAAELWAHGKRARRRRVAGVAATVLAVAAVATGIGLSLTDPNDDRSPEPAAPLRITLPVEYPAHQDLPDLGRSPGPLAAVWLAPRPDSGTPEVVGLVAGTGAFGTLTLDLPSPAPGEPPGWDVALSTDGRRLAYLSSTGALVVHDLVGGDDVSPAVRARPGFTWVDATRLVGHDGRGGDADAFVWEPGRTPRLVDYYDFASGFDLWPPETAMGPLDCSPPPKVGDGTELIGTTSGQGFSFDVPELCDVLGVIGSDTLIGHWKDPHDRNGTVVALDVQDGPPFTAPTLRQKVVLAGAPDRVSLATDLVGRALGLEGGAS